MNARLESSKKVSVDALLLERKRLEALLQSVPEQIRQINEKIRAASFSTHEGLSRRQEQVLLLVRRNLSNKEIGGRLNITERTVKFHVSRLITKCLNKYGFSGMRRDL